MRLRKKQQSFVDSATNNGSSLDSLFWKRFRRNRMAMASIVVIALFALVAILGYLITPDHTPYCNQQYLELASKKPFSKASFAYVKDSTLESKHSLPATILHGRPLDSKAIPIYSYRQHADSITVETYTGSIPNDGELLTFHNDDVRIGNRTFIFGTDTYGRDVLSQVMIGSRVSLSVGFIAVAIALLIGILLGSLAAYYGGWVDNLIMWFINVVWSIPTVLLVIAITFALGKGFWQVFIAVGLTMWVDVARVVRGQVLSVKEKEYVEAARALGFRTPRIIFRHILPNIMGPVIVITASNHG